MIRLLRVLRVALWVLVAVAGAAALASLIVPERSMDAGQTIYATPFSLIDQNGEIVTQANFLGKPSAWFYGFTQCPEVCPATLTEMSRLLDALGPDADKLRVVFVSVDPERDTVEDYVDYFDQRIIGLTGPPEAVSAMAKARYASFEKVPLADGGYTMEHSTGIHLADADGAFVGTLDTKEPFDTRVEKLRRLIE